MDFKSEAVPIQGGTFLTAKKINNALLCSISSANFDEKPSPGSACKDLFLSESLTKKHSFIGIKAGKSIYI